MVRVVSILKQICAGLTALHERSFVHRDLKPSNIFLGPDGLVTLLDFEVARDPTNHLTQIGMLIGTPRYMSPEQIRGKADLDYRALFAAMEAARGGDWTLAPPPREASEYPLTLDERAGLFKGIPPATLLEPLTALMPTSPEPGLATADPKAPTPSSDKRSWPPRAPSDSWYRSTWYSVGVPTEGASQEMLGVNPTDAWFTKALSPLIRGLSTGVTRGVTGALVKLVWASCRAGTSANAPDSNELSPLVMLNGPGLRTLPSVSCRGESNGLVGSSLKITEARPTFINCIDRRPALSSQVSPKSRVLGSARRLPSAETRLASWQAQRTHSIEMTRWRNPAPRPTRCRPDVTTAVPIDDPGRLCRSAANGDPGRVVPGRARAESHCARGLGAQLCIRIAGDASVVGSFIDQNDGDSEPTATIRGSPQLRRP